MALHWRLDMYHKVQQYIEYGVSSDMAPVFLAWWDKFGSEILNEFDWVIDESADAARSEALKDAYLVINRDANIDSKDINVSRALHHLKVLIAEAEQEVEYEEDQVWADYKRSKEAEEGLDK